MNRYRVVGQVWVAGALVILMSFLVPVTLDLWGAHQARLAVWMEWHTRGLPPPYEPDFPVRRAWSLWMFTFSPKNEADDKFSRNFHWKVWVDANGENAYVGGSGRR